MNGRLLKKQPGSNNSTVTLSYSGYPAGIYVMEVQTVEGRSSHKLVKVNITEVKGCQSRTSPIFNGLTFQQRPVRVFDVFTNHDFFQFGYFSGYLSRMLWLSEESAAKL